MSWFGTPPNNFFSSSETSFDCMMIVLTLSSRGPLLGATCDGIYPLQDVISYVVWKSVIVHHTVNKNWKQCSFLCFTFVNHSMKSWTWTLKHTINNTNLLTNSFSLFHLQLSSIPLSSTFISPFIQLQTIFNSFNFRFNFIPKLLFSFIPLFHHQSPLSSQSYYSIKLHP